MRYREQMAVPNAVVGSVIGKGGEVINALQTRTGCHINVRCASRARPPRFFAGNRPAALARSN